MGAFHKTLSVMAALVLTAQAGAQEVNERAVQISSCSVANVGDQISGPLLQARCGQSKTMIGAADRYDIQANPRTGSVAVSLTLRGVPQVVLVYPGEGGIPMVQDVSGAMAHSIGRGRDRGLAETTIDLSEFATSGAIAATETDARLGSVGRTAKVAVDALQAGRIIGRTGEADDLRTSH